MKETNVPIRNQISPQAMERFKRPRHQGPLASFNGHARITGPCGDTMEIWIRVSAQRIVEVGFSTTGCGSSRAAGSGATELALGKPLTEAVNIDQAEILALLGGLPQKSEHCALLAANTLQAAIQDFSN
jgi:nitrogen fixation protein NifU and related proteins